MNLELSDDLKANFRSWEPGHVPKPLVDAYKDLDTNFRAWMTDHEDQADRLADMLVERHPGLNRDLAGILAGQWVKPE